MRFEQNLLDADPRFIDPAASNFQLQPDSPAWKLGFQRIPIETIGLYASKDRPLDLPSGRAASPSDVAVIVDRNDTAVAGPAFSFPRVPAPVRNDAAAGIVPVLIDGRRDSNGADLGSLVDGAVPGDEDQPGRNFFFAAGTDGGRILMDLGRAIDLQQVNTYSWHAGPRGPQVYVLHASSGQAGGFDPRPPRDKDPAACGWTTLARIDARSKDSDAGGQYGVSVRASGASGGSLGTFRYLLFEISRTEDRDPFGNTFFSEIDVVERGGPALERIAATHRPESGTRSKPRAERTPSSSTRRKHRISPSGPGESWRRWCGNGIRS